MASFLDIIFLVSISLLYYLLVGMGVGGPARIALGFLIALLFPGYALTLALFPRKDHLDITERGLLTLGLSFAIVALIGLALNYTPWGIRLLPLLTAVTLFILIAASVGWYRRKRLPQSERFFALLRLPHLPRPNLKEMSQIDRALSFALGTSLLLAIGVLAFAVLTPKPGEKYSQFYLLGPGGEAADYPSQLVVGQAGKVTLGIVNREMRRAAYWVEVRIQGERVGVSLDGRQLELIGPIALPSGDSWERLVAFAPQTAGAQKVEFLLYEEKRGALALKERLYLWIDVRP